MILWLALPLMCLRTPLEKVLPRGPKKGRTVLHLRREANTTRIFFQLRVIETLPLGQGPCPAIPLLRLVLSVLVRLFLFNVLTIDLLQETHSSAGNRQRMLAMDWIFCC